MLALNLNILGSVARGGQNQIWNDIPVAPFAPTTTLTYAGIASSSGSVVSSDIGAHKDIALSGVWNRMRASALIGNAGERIRFVNEDVNTRIGNREHADWEDWLCIDAINGSDFCEFWGKAVDAPLWLDGNDNGGFSWIGGAANSTIKGYNLLLTNQGWASIFMNSDNGYEFIEIIGARNFGSDEDGEGTYLGTTTKSDSLGTTAYCHIKDFLSTERGRDGNQANNHYNLQIDGITIYNVGIADMSGQRALIQFQNCRGIVKNSIYHNAPSAGVIASHGLVLFNNYFKWASGNLIHQNIASEYSAVTLPEKLPGRNRLPVFYIDCDFAPDASANITVQDSESDIIAINCNFNSNVAEGLFADNRGDTSTHSLQVINCVEDATIPEPTYTNFEPTDYNNHGLCTHPYHYGKARGNRTHDSRKRPVPTFDILSVSAISDINVNEGTTFENVPLPAVVQVSIDSSILDSPINVKVPVTWAEGDYDGDVQDTYSLVGTIQLPEWYVIKNPESYTASVNVNVVEPAFNPFTDIAWVAAFNPVDAEADLAAGTPFWTNHGSGSNAAQGNAENLPISVNAATRSGKGVSFTNSPQTGLQYGSGTVNEPFETWIEIITPSSFSSTQRIYANGSATRLSINSSGELLLAGTTDVATGITLSANTRYVLRIVNNGASSSITVNNGTPVGVTITAQNGSSTPKLGHAYSAGSGHWTGIMGDFFQKSTALSSGEIADMWDWFGF